MKSFSVVRALAVLPTFVFVLSVAFPVAALADPPVWRVEEDWELVVTTPETNSNSPQITVAMSPLASDESEYVTFEINHRSQPDYGIGGLHLLAWNGNFFVLDSAHAQAGVQLNTSDEVITWTQSLELVSGSLTYAITNGSSATWGEFGTGELSVTVDSQCQTLNSYNPQNSIASTGVGFGANRVASLTLKRVRYFTPGGEVEVTLDHNVLETSE